LTVQDITLSHSPGLCGGKATQQDIEHADADANEMDLSGAIPANSASTSITATTMRVTWNKTTCALYRESCTANLHEWADGCQVTGRLWHRNLAGARTDEHPKN
jgi:hypothetical protein